MSLIPVLDNGHGGVINGSYLTPGKRSPNWDKGVLYEGMLNRWIVSRLIYKMDLASIPYFHVSPELEDVTLRERVRRADEIYRKHKNTYVVSIHANAGGGTGQEVFTSKGETASDPIAEKFVQGLEGMLGLKMRKDTTDGDSDKEADFYILRNTDGPAVLIEVGFMDNKHDYDLMWTEEFLEEVTDRLLAVIIELYRG
jgi:N-acetylmuramoyl-L-alanine amidase